MSKSEGHEMGMFPHFKTPTLDDLRAVQGRVGDWWTTPWMLCLRAEIGERVHAVCRKHFKLSEEDAYDVMSHMLINYYDPRALAGTLLADVELSAMDVKRIIASLAAREFLVRRIIDILPGALSSHLGRVQDDEPAPVRIEFSPVRLWIQFHQNRIRVGDIDAAVQLYPLIDWTDASQQQLLHAAMQAVTPRPKLQPRQLIEMVHEQADLRWKGQIEKAVASKLEGTRYDTIHRRDELIDRLNAYKTYIPLNISDLVALFGLSEDAASRRLSRYREQLFDRVPALGARLKDLGLSSVWREYTDDKDDDDDK